MNELITSIFANFMVNNQTIPVKWLYYHGHGEPYVTWQEESADNSYAGDDDLMGWVEYYDFDVYSKGDYMPIIERVKELLKQNNFVFQPSRSSQDLYEEDTGYYHKTLNFAYMRTEV